ncbi:hypothetical protein VFPPC_18714 [Pochonia chlamydosporia 170]|uniref:Uncharacterized protein n=1 Tax=Pochonia chlamydosporia 170 TaxID=1380566 RepID=A0A219ASJ9_METCM|nr:hypothetical protein VFPPC_18714 [Pochonia chlamydosporia 170]OWT43559.1 hypothetical protein VFPPC_18714 [Pochonia chlamydosporia 170]
MEWSITDPIVLTNFALAITRSRIAPGRLQNQQSAIWCQSRSSANLNSIAWIHLISQEPFLEMATSKPNVRSLSQWHCRVRPGYAACKSECVTILLCIIQMGWFQSVSLLSELYAYFWAVLSFLFPNSCFILATLYHCARKHPPRSTHTSIQG